MSMQEIMLRMWPYWIIGIIVLFGVYKSEHKDLLRFDKKAAFKWVLVLLGITAYRLLTFKLYSQLDTFRDTMQNMTIIPWQMAFTTYWEDACHGLPLVIMRRMMPKTKWSKFLQYILLAITMLSFASGHLYQGVIPAALLSLYIPFSMSRGEKFGFGTVIFGHILYDLSTMLFIKWAIGAM